MATIEELLSKAVNKYKSGEEEEGDEPQQVQPQQPAMSPEQSQQQKTLIEQMLNSAVKNYDPAENASNKVLEDENKVVDTSGEPLVVAPEDNPIYTEYYNKRKLPINDTYTGERFMPLQNTFTTTLGCLSCPAR